MTVLERTEYCPEDVNQTDDQCVILKLRSRKAVPGPGDRCQCEVLNEFPSTGL
jgi:hypothetical protein